MKELFAPAGTAAFDERCNQVNHDGGVIMVAVIDDGEDVPNGWFEDINDLP